MTTEPQATLSEITQLIEFEIEALGHLLPLGDGIDWICYHLHDDPLDDHEHRNADEVYAALCEVGVNIERSALDDYPWEIWEKRWPTSDWPTNDLPNIFDVLNRFGHGIYSVSYDPRGPAHSLYHAAFRDAWDNADPNTRRPNCEAEDLSAKAATVVFNVRLNEAAYREVKDGKFTFMEAARRVAAIQDKVRSRWPNKEAEARMLLGIPRMRDIPRFDDQHEELLNWAIWQVINDDAEKAN